MTYSPARGDAPAIYADDAVDVSSGPQETALIWELRRLQRFLDEERLRERKQFPCAVDLEPANRFSRRGEGPGTSLETEDSTVDRVLDKLQLNRRNRPG